MKLNRTRASVVSVVVAVLTVIPSGEWFSILMRGAVNDTGRVITSSVVHECVSCTPGSGFLGSFVCRVMSRQLYLLSLVILRISLHKLLNSLHSRQRSRSRSGKGRSRDDKSCRNSNCKRGTCLLTLWNLNFKKRTMARGLLNLLCHYSSDGCSRHDDRYGWSWWM